MGLLVILIGAIGLVGELALLEYLEFGAVDAVQVVGCRTTPVLRVLLPRQDLTMSEVARAMIHCAREPGGNQLLEISDLKALADA